MTSQVGKTERSGPSAVARRALRSAFGLWVLHEARNKIVLGPRSRAWRRFEDAEVARLRPVVAAALAERGLPARWAVVTVVPTYRRPELLPAAVASALAQTVDDHLVVVVDDGGGLPELPAHPRLIAVSLARNTAVLGVVRNVGIRITDSEFVAFLDDDNRWRDRHLDVATASLRAGADLVYTAVERHRADGTVVDTLSRPFDRKAFADEDSWVDANSLVVRRSPAVVFSRLPRTKRTLPKEDWEFVHRLARRHVVEHVPEPTVRYLVNDASYYTTWAPDNAGG